MPGTAGPVGEVCVIQAKVPSPKFTAESPAMPASISAEVANLVPGGNSVPAGSSAPACSGAPVMLICPGVVAPVCSVVPASAVAGVSAVPSTVSVCPESRART